MTRLFMDGTLEEMNRRLYIVRKLLGNFYIKTESMCDELFLAGYDRSFLEKIHKMISVHTIEKDGNEVLCPENLKERYGMNIHPEKMLSNSRTWKLERWILPYYSADLGIATIFLEPDAGKREFVDIYEFRPPAHIYCGRELRYMMLVSVKNSIDAQDIKLLNHILQMIKCDKNAMKGLITDTAHTIEALFCRAVKDAFLNE